MDFSQPYASARSPVLGDNVVATSQPLAAQAGLAMLAQGGNAIDAALASAMALTVVEPTGCGLGSDAFAIVWDGQQLQGLNASGRAPAAWTPERFAHLERMPDTGWDAVTVPGAVSGWIALWQRGGSLPLETLAEPAIRLARQGFLLSPMIATLWQQGLQRLRDQPGFTDTFAFNGQAPQVGQRVKLPHHADSLEAIARTEGRAFYEGHLAEAMVAHSQQHGGALQLDDLATHRADWVGTIGQRFGQHEVHEIPPNGQGLATLIGLALLDELGIGEKPVDDLATIHLMIEATKLAMADAEVHLTDPDHMKLAAHDLLDPSYIRERAALIDRRRASDPGHGTPRPGGTVYVSTADSEGRMVSFIQSNFMGFGSGVVVPQTGISLQNRGWSFSLDANHANVVAPRKRPFHTIIPGFAMNADGTPAMSFGVMGGPMQAQGHLQQAVRILRYGQNPQAAANAPRWRIGAGRRVAVESTFPPELVSGLTAMGHDVQRETPDAVFGFGGAQTIYRLNGGYIAGSDPRKDGQAVAF